MTFLDLVLSYLGVGAYSKDPVANHVQQASAYCEALETADGLVDDLVHDEMWPATADELLPEWEAFTGVTPPTGATKAQQRRAVIEKLRRRGSLHADYIAEQLETYSNLLPVILEFYPFLLDFSELDEDCVEKQWTFYAAYDRDDAFTAGMDPDLHIEQVIVDKLKPAHADGVACFLGFLCDDEYSLTDRDLLGA